MTNETGPESTRRIVEELFQRAVDLTREERDVFLQENCDGSVFEKVVELLELHDRTDPLVVDSPERFEPVLAETALELDQIAGYRLLRRLGEGGMGIVFEAEQENPRRRVAVKVMHPIIVSSKVRRRFELEGEILGQLHHPGIAEVYEAGTAQTARGELPFIAMELVDGEPLLVYARARALDTTARLELMETICSAVDHAHTRGVIHRDLKPANILVDGRGHPRILDFGVARSTDSDLLATTIHTQMGQLIGTLPYMSPEQLHADPREIDTRSDVYALGVILFELLAGRLPYDLSERSIPEVIRVVDTEDPSLLGSIDRTLRGDIEAIVASALEKEKCRRYRSAMELAADIRHYLRNEPVTASRQTGFYQARKFLRRNKVLATSVAMIFLALVLGTTISTWQYFAKSAALEQESKALRRSEGSGLLYASSLRLDDDPGAALRLAIEGAERSPGLMASHVVIEALRAVVGEKVFARMFVVLRGHIRPVLSASFSPDGGRVVTGGYDGTARIWDAESGDELLVRPVDGNQQVYCAAFGPDGGRVITASGHLAEMWNAETGTLVTLFQGHQGPVRSASVSADGLRALTASLDGTARIWDAGTGVELLRLETGGGLRSAHFSPDGHRVLTSVSRGDACIWDARSGEELVRLKARSSTGYSAAFSPDGERVVATAYNVTRIWNARSGEQILDFERDSDWLRSARFSPDGKRVLTASLDGFAVVWDARSGEVFAGLRKRDNAVYDDALYAAEFSPDGTRLVTASHDGTAVIWPADVLAVARRYVPERVTPRMMDAFQRGSLAESRSRLQEVGADGEPPADDSVESFRPDEPYSTIQIPGTRNLDKSFTLAARVDFLNIGLTRLFSSYTGSLSAGRHNFL